MQERRRSARTRVDLRAVIHAEDPGDLIASTADVSRHGLFIRTHAVVEVGTPVYLEIDVGDETIAIDGVVVRVAAAGDAGHGAGLGIVYTAIGDEALRRLLTLTQED